MQPEPPTPPPTTTQLPERYLRQQTIASFLPTRRQVHLTRKLANIYWGDYLRPKDTDHLHIYLHNPNRISAKDEFVDFQYFCQNLLSNKVDIFCLPGTGINWKQHKPRNRCHNIMSDFWTHSRSITSTSDVPSASIIQYVAERAPVSQENGWEGSTLKEWTHTMDWDGGATL
jgi:hypothetical protein